MGDESLDREIAAFEKMRGELAQRFGSDWIVMHGQKVAGHFQQFDDAARFAAARFANASALIRQVNSDPVQVPFLLVKG